MQPKRIIGGLSLGWGRGRKGLPEEVTFKLRLEVRMGTRLWVMGNRCRGGGGSGEEEVQGRE